MTKIEPGLRITVTDKNGEANEEATKDLKLLMKGGKKLVIEISASLLAAILEKVAEHIVEPSNDYMVKTDGVAINQIDSPKKGSCFKTEVYMFPE